jgi:hypothetical protein
LELLPLCGEGGGILVEQLAQSLLVGRFGQGATVGRQAVHERQGRLWQSCLTHHRFDEPLQFPWTVDALDGLVDHAEHSRKGLRVLGLDGSEICQAGL